MPQNIDALIDKFIEDSFVGKSKLSDSAIKAIRENLVSGIRTYHESFLSANPPSLGLALDDELKMLSILKDRLILEGHPEDSIRKLETDIREKHQHPEMPKYLFPVRLLYGNKDGYTVQWFYKLGYSPNDLFVYHNMVNNNTNNLEFEELPKGIIKQAMDGTPLVEVIKKMKEAHYDVSKGDYTMMSWLGTETDEVTRMRERGYAKKDIGRFKKSLADYQSREWNIDKMKVNLILTNEQIRNNNSLLRHPTSPSTDLLIKNIKEYKQDVSGHLDLHISYIFLDYKEFYYDTISKIAHKLKRNIQKS